MKEEAKTSSAQRVYEKTRPSYLSSGGDYIVPFPAGDKKQTITFLGYEIRLKNMERLKSSNPAAWEAFERSRGNLDRLKEDAERGDTNAQACLWAAPWWKYGETNEFVSVVDGANAPIQNEPLTVIGKTEPNPNDKSRKITRLYLVTDEPVPAEQVEQPEGVHTEAE